MLSPSGSARTRIFVSSSGRMVILMASPILYQHNSTPGGDFCHGTAAEIAELYVVSLELAVVTNKRRNFYPTEAVRRSSGCRAGCVLFFTVKRPGTRPK